MLDSLGDKLHIFGFDISDEVIKQAKNNIVQLLIDCNTQTLSDLCAEKFIISNDYSLMPYQKKRKEKFLSYYCKLGEPYKVPVWPDAREQLDKLNALMQNKAKYEKEKNEYNKKIMN